MSACGPARSYSARATTDSCSALRKAPLLHPTVSARRGVLAGQGCGKGMIERPDLALHQTLIERHRIHSTRARHGSWQVVRHDDSEQRVELRKQPLACSQ